LQHFLYICSIKAKRNIMFKRLIIKGLQDWRNSVEHLPLVVRGTRQVGKTTLIHQFGETFSNYLYLNLERSEDKELMETKMPLRDLVTLLFVRLGKDRRQGDTLIFIDEIQNSPQTVARLRYFYEDMPELYVVAAGSLLENIVDVNVSFPVGRVDYLPVRPCSFREFLVATGRENQIEVMRMPEYTTPFHNEYMSFFNQYCLVGGMPEAVQHFADTQDLLSVEKVYRRLLRGYMDDVEKYAKTSKMTETVRFLMQYGWYQAGAVIKLGNFAGSEYRSREVAEAFRLLQKAMLLELVYPSTSTRIPALPEHRRMPKLFWMDTGMLNYAAKIRTEIISANNLLDVWKGRIGEQIVAQELLTLNNDINQTRSFWTKGKGDSGAEVDLTWVVDSHLIPIEVKTGHNSHLRSLHSFIDEAPIDLAVRVWSGPFSIDDVVTTIKRKKFRLLNIPFYLVGELENIVRKNS